MVRGIIYMYTSPSGKSYIGQTIDEKKRRDCWLSSNYAYAGDKINKARAKYGKDSFSYEVLFSRLFTSKEEATAMLDTLEIFYIQLYNTVKNGYNCEKGGHNHAGYVLSEEAKKNSGAAIKAWLNSPEGKAKMSAARKGLKKKKGYRIEKNYKPVVQLSLDGMFIQKFPSMRDAEESIGRGGKRGGVNIGNVCRGKRDSAYGYIWLFEEDYNKYFLSPSSNVPKGVARALLNIDKKLHPAPKKPKKKQIYKRKEGPKINRFAKQMGQYDSNLNLVKVWRNGMEAGKSLGISIDNIYRASRTLGMYKDYYWRKYEGQQTIQKKVKVINPLQYDFLRKKVVQKDLQGNIVAIHDSVEDAYKSIGAKHATCISRCLNGKAHTAYGYIWEKLKCS